MRLSICSARNAESLRVRRKSIFGCLGIRRADNMTESDFEYLEDQLARLLRHCDEGVGNWARAMRIVDDAVQGEKERIMKLLKATTNCLCGSDRCGNMAEKCEGLEGLIAEINEG